MMKVAIMVDGGFFHKRANTLWGMEATPKQRADELIEHCFRHVNYTNSHNELYRIYYYDSPPLEGVIYHPYLKQAINLSITRPYRWMTEFHNELRTRRKVALRFGRLAAKSAYTLPTDIIKKLFSGAITLEDVKENDFSLDIKQKGVDMMIGIDIASIAFKQLASQIVLISGDSDFIPAAKLARREGIDFILDPMWANISLELQEHIDGLRSPTSRPVFGGPPPFSSPIPFHPQPQYNASASPQPDTVEPPQPDTVEPPQPDTVEPPQPDTVEPS
jgi:uncharacterized LabA/DUF88 family protein